MLPSIIRNVRKTTFEEVEKVLDNSNDQSHHFTTYQQTSLLELKRWANRRKNFRLKNGATVFNIPNAEFIITDGGRNVDISVKSFPNAQDLVQEMMILGGEIAASYSIQHDLPIPFRIQKAPNIETNSSSGTETLSSEWQRIMSISRAFTSPDPELHYAIGLNQYARATSPIRRYSDILIHYQIKSHLQGRDLPFDSNFMEKISMSIDQKEREAKELQKRSERFWTHRYFISKGIGSIYDGIVLNIKEKNFGLNSHHTDVLIKNLSFVAKVNLPKRFPPGDSITLRLEDATNFRLKFNTV